MIRQKAVKEESVYLRKHLSAPTLWQNQLDKETGEEAEE